MESVSARVSLIRALQLAYSGELGAALAYVGHRVSVGRSPDRRLIAGILKDELRHRRILLAMLHDLGAAPDPRSERKMKWIGRSIGFLCQIGGWYIPMYGAARFEARNIVEYEDIARLAWCAQRHGDSDTLLHLAEVEWDHEIALRQRTADHWAWRISPKWQAPAPRDTIRDRFEAFRKNPPAATAHRPAAASIAIYDWLRSD